MSSKWLLDLFLATDLDALIDAAFGLLAEAVPCDFVSGFYRYSDKGLLKERDSRGREYGPDFARRSIELNPAIPLARSQPGIKLLRTRTGLPPFDVLKHSEFYREIMKTQGWRHAVALCFWTDPPANLPIFVASVYRRAGRRDFSDDDCTRLTTLHSFINCAVNRLYQLVTAQSVREGMAMSVRRASCSRHHHVRAVEAT